MLILVLALLLPFQEAKVVIQTGVAEADVYLDGNFVAKTTQDGSLVMESFPSGSFHFSVRKQGYGDYSGSFSLQEGEAKEIRVAMEETTEGRGQRAEGSEKTVRGSVRSGETKQAAGSRLAEKTGREKPRAGKTKAVGSGQRAETTVRSETPKQVEPPPAEEAGGVTPWIAIGGFAAAAAGLWMWYRRRPVPEAPFPEEEIALMPEEIPPPAANAGRPAPEFIEELRKKEELINSGLVEPGRETNGRRPEKEIVIVLPKDAYRYEDEK